MPGADHSWICSPYSPVIKVQRFNKIGGKGLPMDISSLIGLQFVKKSPKKSEHGKCPKIDEIQDGRQPNSRNMIIVIVIVLMIPNSSVIYLIIPAFLATYDGCSFKTVKSRKNKMAAKYI